jgi:hypothetical protein
LRSHDGPKVSKIKPSLIEFEKFLKKSKFPKIKKKKNEIVWLVLWNVHLKIRIYQQTGVLVAASKKVYRNKSNFVANWAFIVC